MPAQPAAGGLTLPAALHVSFQRYARPSSAAITRAPSSLGALPVARAASGDFALPVAAGEAFWIGLEVLEPGVHRDLAVRFEPASRPAVDALSGAAWSDATPTWIEVPPHVAIDGIALAGGGFRPFVRTALSEEDASTAVVALLTRSEATRVLLVDFDTFESMTGHSRPAPLDPGAQYGGWRLP